MSRDRIRTMEESADAIADGVQRMATAYEEMLAIQKKKTAAPTTSNSSEKRERGPKGDVLTVTGRVLSFGTARGRGDIPLKTKKGIDTGFECMIFSGTQAAVCSQAFDLGTPLVVSYVVDGKYNNIEGVELGAASTGQQGKPRADYDDSAESGDPF